MTAKTIARLSVTSFFCLHPSRAFCPKNTIASLLRARTCDPLSSEPRLDRLLSPDHLLVAPEVACSSSVCHPTICRKYRDFDSGANPYLAYHYLHD